MRKILLVGAGGIGSRHLQALAKSEIPLQIQVVSRSEKSLDIAKERFLQANNNAVEKRVEYYTNLNQITSKVDVAVVATNSDVRRNVIESLLNKTEISYLILEKVLFQKLKDYEMVEHLLEQKHVKAWVNCPRRLMPFYQEMKKFLPKNERIYYTVQGGDWNLACGAIHFIDLLSFFTEETDIEVDVRFLDKEIKESKRNGFWEFTGKLYCRTKNGSELILMSVNNASAPYLVTILSESAFCVIDEVSGMAKIALKNNLWQWEQTDFKFYLQSELTHLVVKDLFETGNCPLTPLHDSSLLHKPMVEGFICHIEKITNKKWGFCPIT